jgi:hypothetical protein
MATIIYCSGNLTIRNHVNKVYILYNDTEIEFDRMVTHISNITMNINTYYDSDRHEDKIQIDCHIEINPYPGSKIKIEYSSDLIDRMFEDYKKLQEVFKPFIIH